YCMHCLVSRKNTLQIQSKIQTGVSIVRPHTHMPSDPNCGPRRMAAGYTKPVSEAGRPGPLSESPNRDCYRCHASFLYVIDKDRRVRDAHSGDFSTAFTSTTSLAARTNQKHVGMLVNLAAAKSRVARGGSSSLVSWTGCRDNEIHSSSWKLDREPEEAEEREKKERQREKEGRLSIRG
ncbi:hypothetical protein X777_07854, partial [Ooceraea biroi]